MIFTAILLPAEVPVSGAAVASSTPLTLRVSTEKAGQHIRQATAWLNLFDFA